MSALPAFELELLGTPRVSRGGAPQRFPDRRSLGLVAVLAIDGPTGRGRLAALLWDEQADADARRNLRRELHRLRDSGLDGLVDSAGETLGLAASVDVDCARFEAATARGDDAGALAVYRGGLLHGFTLAGAPAFADWLAARRETLAQRWRGLVERRCDDLQARGDVRGALSEATRLLADDTLQERHFRRVITLHGLLGEREAALDVYERCRKALGRELGLRPLAETVDVAERIRAGGMPVAEAAPAPRHDGRVPPRGALAVLPVVPALVGRDDVLPELRARLATQRLALVEGTAGIGKSRLLLALAEDGEPVRIHSARSGDLQVPFASLARWLRAGRPAGGRADSARTGEATPSGLAPWVAAELARLLPELGEPPAATGADTERMRLHEAARLAWRAWFGDAGVHVFDDWQFVDAASARWWSWWREQEAESFRVVVALRPDETRGEAALVLRDAARAAGAVPIGLGPLDEGAMLQLVAKLSGSERPERFSRRLWQATGGNPFFAFETLAHLLDRGILRVDAQGRWSTPYDDATADYRELPTPPSVHAAVVARVGRLGEAAERLLEAASLVGDDFDLALASSGSALGEWEAVRALEAALEARIVRRLEAREGVYRFEHDLIAQTLQARLSPERRALVHRSLGARLAQTEAPAARVAEHFERGGDVAAACRWRLRALEAARRRFVPGDVIAEAERVLALAPVPAQAIAAHLARAFALRQRARPDDAEHALADAERLVGDDDPVELQVALIQARAHHASRGGEPAKTLPAIDALLGDARLDAHQRALLLSSRGRCLRALGRVAESTVDLRAALDGFDADATVERGEGFDDLARNALHRRAYDEVLANAHAALAALHGEERAAAVASASTMAGIAHLSKGEFEAALEWLTRARETAARAGLIGLERGAILNLVPTLHALGRYDRAQALLEQGYALSTLFSSLAEQQAFVEARHVCQAIAGDLGAAIDAWHDLVRFSEGLGDLQRRICGLLVAADLPLVLGDVAAAARVVDQTMAIYARTDLSYLIVQAHAKAAWLDWWRGDRNGALEHVRAAAAIEEVRPDDRAYRRHAELLVHLSAGDRDAAAGALQVMRDSAVAEVWSLGVGTFVHYTGDGVAEAFALLESGDVPPLHQLELLEAMAAGGALAGADGAAWRREGEALAARLRASLERHIAERTLFDARYRRWLAGAPSAPTSP